MIDRDLIRKAFRQRLLEVPEVEVLRESGRIAWEGRGFDTPNPPDVWLRETLIPGQEVLAASNLLELVALIQYDLYNPIGMGTEPLEALAKKVADKFKPGTGWVRTNGAQVTVVRAYTSPGAESSIGDQVWFQLPVVVSFRAYGTNHDD